MWRVIIRIGYFNDAGSRLRGRVIQFFNNMGLQNTATGTFESAAGVNLRAGGSAVGQCAASHRQSAAIPRGKSHLRA